MSVKMVFKTLFECCMCGVLAMISLFIPKENGKRVDLVGEFLDRRRKKLKVGEE